MVHILAPSDNPQTKHFMGLISEHLPVPEFQPHGTTVHVSHRKLFWDVEGSKSQIKAGNSARKATLPDISHGDWEKEGPRDKEV